MKITLYVDLVWTDLEDFIEHFAGDLATGLSMGTPKLLGGDGRMTWIQYDALRRPGSMPVWDIRPKRHGNTGFEWWAFWNDGDGDETAWYVRVWRYRQDRLALALWETDPERGQADRLREWLVRRWGEDGLIERPIENTPAPPIAPDPMPRLPERAPEEQWFAAFDWYYRQPRGSVGDLEDFARRLGKSTSRTNTKHADYQAGKR